MSLKETNETVYKIIGSCMEVHKALGPGLPLEFYAAALEIEMTEKALAFERNKEFPSLYKEKQIGTVVLDFHVEGNVVVAIRAQTELKDIEIQQVLRQLSLSSSPIGLLVNFGNIKIQYKRILPSRQMREPRKEVLRPLAYREMGKTREGNPIL
jgi:GxxExxY protein